MERSESAALPSTTFTHTGTRCVHVIQTMWRSETSALTHTVSVIHYPASIINALCKYCSRLFPHSISASFLTIGGQAINTVLLHFQSVNPDVQTDYLITSLVQFVMYRELAKRRKSVGGNSPKSGSGVTSVFAKKFFLFQVIQTCLFYRRADNVQRQQIIFVSIKNKNINTFAACCHQHIMVCFMYKVVQIKRQKKNNSYPYQSSVTFLSEGVHCLEDGVTIEVLPKLVLCGTAVYQLVEQFCLPTGNFLFSSTGLEMINIIIYYLDV